MHAQALARAGTGRPSGSGRGAGGGGAPTALRRRVRACPTRPLPPTAAAATPPSDDAGASDLKLPLAGADTDWRAFRAALVASTTASAAGAPQEAPPPPRPDALWAHALAAPERGCLLVAHPLMFASSQTYFSQAVIFLIEHGPEGSAGLILCKPTQFRLGDVGGVEALCPEFADARLMLGGDVERSSLHVLHDCAGLEGSVPVIPGVRVGGVDAAPGAVRAGDARPSDFVFLNGYCGWRPGQLAEECAAGVWFPAAGSAALALAARAHNSPDEGKRADGKTLTGRGLWHTVLELMGGEHAALSAAMRGDADERVIRLVKRAQQASEGEGGGGGQAQGGGGGGEGGGEGEPESP